MVRHACFGLKEIDADVGERFEKDLRRADGAEADADPIPVALRASALGDKRRVVDISRLADSFAARLGQTMTPGQFAFQMCERSEQVVFDIS